MKLRLKELQLEQTEQTLALLRGFIPSTATSTMGSETPWLAAAHDADVDVDVWSLRNSLGSVDRSAMAAAWLGVQRLRRVQAKATILLDGTVQAARTPLWAPQVAHARAEAEIFFAVVASPQLPRDVHMREAASANARFSSVEAGLDGLIERSVTPPSDESDQDPEAEPEELRALEAATAACEGARRIRGPGQERGSVADELDCSRLGMKEGLAEPALHATMRRHCTVALASARAAATESASPDDGGIGEAAALAAAMMRRYAAAPSPAASLK